jgi:hypothetical protein
MQEAHNTTQGLICALYCKRIGAINAQKAGDRPTVAAISQETPS